MLTALLKGKSFASETAITLASRAVVIVLLLSFAVIVARVLGPADRGSYGALILIVTLGGSLTLCGISGANVYYGAREPRSADALFGNSLILSLALGALAALCVAGFARLPAGQEYLTRAAVDLEWLLVAALFLPARLALVTLNQILRSRGDILLFNGVEIVQAACLVGGGVVFVWLLRWGIAGAVIADIAATMSASIAVIVALLVKYRLRPRVEFGAMRRVLAFGARLHLGNIAQFLNYRLDVFLIGYLLGAWHVGIYLTATQIAEKLLEFPRALRTALLHRVAASREAERSDENTALVLRAGALLLGAACLAAAALGYPLIRLVFGEAFSASFTPLLWLLPGVWAIGLAKVVATHLTGRGEPIVGTHAAFLSLVATLVLTLVLIPRIGLSGAAIASSTAYALSFLYLLWVLRARTGLRARDVLLPRRSDLERLTKSVKAMGRRPQSQPKVLEKV